MSPWVGVAIGLTVLVVVLIVLLVNASSRPLSDTDRKCARIDEELDYGRYSPGPRVRD